jgi:hypothetical protein
MIFRIFCAFAGGSFSRVANSERKKIYFVAKVL